MSGMTRRGGSGVRKALTGGVLAAGLLPPGAGAADLPARNASPVEYVRVCSTRGAGFFHIPGTETCLRIGGRVRAEMRYLEPGSRADDATGTRARARIEADARTRTAYGDLRTFVRYEVTHNSGNYGPSTTALDRAFVQFGGLTAGRTQSYFDFYTNDFNFGSILVSDFPTQVLAYTAKLGSGISASLSLEDGIERRFHTSPNGPGFPGQGFIPAGERIPDVVGQLLYEQAWGKAQLSGVLRQIRSGNLAPGALPSAFVETEYGFAVQGGVQLKLPTVAEGDQLWLQGGYSRGALSYLGFGNTAVTDLSLTQTDAFVDPFGEAQLARGWAATILFLHYWTPQIRQAAFGSYGVIDYAATGTLVAPPGGALGFVDTTDWRVGTNLSWLPVSGFYIGVEGLYRRVDPRGRVFADNDPATGRLIGSADALEARLRVQRDF
jgi:hypothetical protein